MLPAFELSRGGSGLAEFHVCVCLGESGDSPPRMLAGLRSRRALWGRLARCWVGLVVGADGVDVLRDEVALLFGEGVFCADGVDEGVHGLGLRAFCWERGMIRTPRLRSGVSPPSYRERERKKARERLERGRARKRRDALLLFRLVSSFFTIRLEKTHVARAKSAELEHGMDDAAYTQRQRFAFWSLLRTRVRFKSDS